MRTNTFNFRNFIVVALLSFALLNCKNESQKTSYDENDANEVVLPSKRSNTSEERKTPTGTVTIQFDGETVSFSDFDPILTTDVIYNENSILFVIRSLEKQSVSVLMKTPGLFDKVPVSISEQSHTIPPEESLTVKTVTEIQVVIPSVPEEMSDFKLLYEGTVTLNEISDNRLVVTFSGTGVPYTDSKRDFFPFEGKIVLENFNVNDLRR